MTALTTPLDPSVPKQQAAANYASVSEQIDELEADNASLDATIAGYRDGIRAAQDRKRANAERARKLRKRKRVFAKARFDLEQIDEN